MFASRPPTCTGRTLDLSRKDSDIRYLRHLGNSDIARNVATVLWRRASKIGLGDDEVTSALELGYKLGLDHEMRPLVERLSALATNPEGHVRQMTLDDAREVLTARRKDIERVYQAYRAGDIPVHMFAQHLKSPLVYWYRRAPLVNQESGRSVAGPTYARHGWRAGPSVPLDPEAEISLHVDLTALLMAYHLGLLEKIEGTLGPIVLPHRTVVALAEMRDAVRPIQPARRDALRIVQDLVTNNRIKVAGREATSTPIVTIPGLEARSARLLAQATDSGCLLVDFLPLTGESAEPLQLAPEHEGVLRSGHCVVESLHVYGEISDTQKAVALDALGPEHAGPPDRSIPKGAGLLCAAGILELLATGGGLKQATRLFSVHVSSDEFESWVQQPLMGLEAAEEDATWLTGLIAHVSRGIDKGIYRVLPDLRDESRVRAARDEESPTLNCLLDLFMFQPRHGDFIWTDDRWLNGYAQRDGVPVVDTVDLLHILRDRAGLSEAEFFSIIHCLREGDFRLISLDASEIKTFVRLAPLRDGDLVETRELRTLRRQYAATLVDGDMLRIAPNEKCTALEWPFVLASGSAVVHAVAEIWQEAQPSEAVEPRAEWILRSLYVPDRGRAFTQVQRSEDIDHRLEAAALSAMLSHAISFPIDSASRVMRRSYFEWIYWRLLRRRFEVDPMLETATIDAFKGHMTSAIDASGSAKKHRRLAVALIRELLVDLPDQFRMTLAEDGDFLGRLGISLMPAMPLGRHEINPQESWNAAARILTTKEPTLIDAKGEKLKVLLLEQRGQQQIVVEDTAARMRYIVPADTVGILSDSASEREARLCGISKLFDLRSSATADAIARVAAPADAATRVMEMSRLQNNSVYNLYVDLRRKLEERQPVGKQDYVPPSIDAVVRHLRLEEDVSMPLEARLESAAATLIDEVGLEETIARMAGLPIPLPAVVVTTVGELTSTDRRALLKHLMREIGKSPLGSAHMARLFMQYAGDSLSYTRYAHTSMRRHILGCESVHCQAWLTVLRVCADEFSYVEAFRMLPVDIRLCVAWSHADRVFRILMNGGLDPSLTKDYFEGWDTRLSTGVAFVDDDYATDVASPRRLMPLHIILAGCSYAFDHGALLNESFKTMVSGFIQADPAMYVRVMRDLTLSPNILNCILCRDGRLGWLSVLTDDLREQVRPEVLRPQVTAAVDSICSGNGGPTEWGVVAIVVHDDPIPSNLSDRMRKGLLMLDLDALHEKDRSTALVAALWSAQHAAALGDDVLSHVRSQLIALATVRGRESPQLSQNDVEESGQMLLSAVMCLYCKSDSSVGGGRFAKIGELLDSVIDRWPALREQGHRFVETLIDGLPNSESRWLWRLQGKLRAAR